MSQGGDGSKGVTDDAAFLKSLLGALPAFVVRAGPDRRIRYINRLAQGFSLEGTIGAPVLDFIAPEYHELAIRTIDRALELDSAQQYLARAQTDHGAYTYYETIVTPVPEADGQRGFVLVAFDVTHTRELEDRLRQTDRLESLGTLTAGVAHNFNNLLAVIRPTLDLLRAHVDGEGRTLLDEAAQATERATSLVKQLMVFAGSRASPSAGPIDLGVAVESAVKLTRRLVGTGVRIEFARPPERLLVRGNSSELEQVIVNLIVNARDALRQSGRADGEIKVTVQRALPGLVNLDELAGARAQVVVEDNGPGIDPAIQPRLFDPFFTTKPAGEGTGLGLAISWSVVRSMGGTIECQSKLQEGARFTVTVPLEATDSAAAGAHLGQEAAR